MRKPQHIIIALIGAGVAAAGVNSFTRPSTTGSSYSSYRPAATRREYRTDEYVSGLGYFHAHYRGFYPYRFNYHDPARGYYHGGLWTPQPLLTTILSAIPAEQWLQQQRVASSSTSGVRSYHGSSFYGGSSTGPSTHSPTTSYRTTGGTSTVSHPSSGSSSHSSFGGFGSHGSSSS